MRTEAARDSNPPPSTKSLSCVSRPAEMLINPITRKTRPATYPLRLAGRPTATWDTFVLLRRETIRPLRLGLRQPSLHRLVSRAVLLAEGLRDESADSRPFPQSLTGQQLSQFRLKAFEEMAQARQRLARADVLDGLGHRLIDLRAARQQCAGTVAPLACRATSVVCWAFSQMLAILSTSDCVCSSMLSRQPSGMGRLYSSERSSPATFSAILSATTDKSAWIVRQPNEPHTFRRLSPTAVLARSPCRSRPRQVSPWYRRNSAPS